MAQATDPTAPPSNPGDPQGGFSYKPSGGAANQQNFSGSPWDNTYALSAYVYKANPIYGKRQPRNAPPGFVGPVSQPLVKGGATPFTLDTATTGQDYLNQFAKVDAHAVSGVQAQLAELGLLQPDSYRVGDGTDERTMSALAGVLRVAALRGISPDAAIDYLKKTTPQSQTLEGQKKSAAQSDAQARQKAVYNSYLGDLQSAYMRTWGVPAPPGYTERAAKAGMNVYEFQAHERSKPAFFSSAAGQTERLNLESQISQWMGRG